MVKIKAKYRKRTTLFGRDLVGVRSVGRALVRVRAKNTLLVGLWLGIRSEIEKNTVFGRALVSVRPKIEKTPFLVGLLLGYGLK